jgi:uncharacterized surface protein with fasciclin (FAS1) repeats
MTSERSLAAIEDEAPNAAALTDTNGWRVSNAGSSLSTAMAFGDDAGLYHARGTRSDQDSYVDETIVPACDEAGDTEDHKNTTSTIELSQAANAVAADHSHSPSNAMKVNRENNSEVGFYKQIQGVHCTDGQNYRVATAVAQPSTLQSISDAFVPAVAMMDEVEHASYPPLPTQVAEGEAATTYDSMGSRIGSPPSWWTHRIGCGHFRWRWLGVIGMMMTVALAVTAGLCGSGYCSSANNDENAAPSPGPWRYPVAPNNCKARQSISRNETDPSTGVDIVTPMDVMSNYSHLATFTRALNWTGLALEYCLFDGNYTVFAPVDNAFKVFGAKFMAKLWQPRWILHLRAIVKNHVTEPSVQRILTEDFASGMTVPMLSGENVTGSIDGNGTVVLASAGTDASAIELSDALVASNSVVHQVNELLLPSFMTTNLMGLINTTVGQEFSISAGFLLKLGLTPLISGFGDVTIFAPANEAYQDLSEEVLASLESNNEYLTAVLSNHLVFDVLPTINIAHGQSYAALSGKGIHFSYTNKNTLMVNDANIIKSDVLANNGILHIIDKVLLEPYTPESSGARAFSESVFALLLVALVCWSW